jgi:hypothetical protein
MRIVDDQAIAALRGQRAEGDALAVPVPVLAKLVSPVR